MLFNLTMIMGQGPFSQEKPRHGGARPPAQVLTAGKYRVQKTPSISTGQAPQWGTCRPGSTQFCLYWTNTQAGQVWQEQAKDPVLRETKSLVLSPSHSGPNTFTKFIRFLGSMDTLVREREAPRGTPQRPPGGPGGPALWIWHFLQVTSFHSYKNTGSRRMPISEMRI